MSLSSHKVDVFAWNLNGISKSVHKALSKLSDVTDGFIPREYLHVGVAVFKRFYHFNTTGILINLEIPTGFKLCGNENYTLKSHEEFENWLTQRRDIYRSKTYDMIANNCIHFAKDVCTFLNVPFEGPQADLNDWLLLHEVLLRPLETIIVHSRLLRAFGVPSNKKKKGRTVVDSINNNNICDSDEDDDEEEWENYHMEFVKIA